MKLAFILALAVALGGEAAAKPSKRPPLSPGSPYLTGKGCPHGWRNYGVSTARRFPPSCINASNMAGNM